MKETIFRFFFFQGFSSRKLQIVSKNIVKIFQAEKVRSRNCMRLAGLLGCGYHNYFHYVFKPHTPSNFNHPNILINTLRPCYMIRMEISLFIPQEIFVAAPKNSPYHPDVIYLVTFFFLSLTIIITRITIYR